MCYPIGLGDGTGEPGFLELAVGASGRASPPKAMAGGAQIVVVSVLEVDLGLRLESLKCYLKLKIGVLYSNV